MKNRALIDHLRRLQGSPLGRIIVLTGARQTGKTTLAKHCFPDFTYLSIEDPVQRESFLRLVASQWETLYPKAILDEVQKAPILIESIKSVYDQYENPRYILLGSSQLLLLEKVRESLAGRCVIIEVHPLILPEQLTYSWDDAVKPSFFKQFIDYTDHSSNILPSFDLDPDYALKQQAFDNYLNYGSYPALSNAALSHEEKREWLSMYVKTFLERDVRDLASFRDLTPFVKLQKHMAQISGELLNYSSVAKETGVSVPTVQRYLQYLELSYQTFILQPWFSNPLKRLVKSPKIHFLDPGVLRAILQKDGTLNGHEFESAVIAEIYKQIKLYKLPISCYHLRTQDGREIDLLLETEEYFIAIEIKATQRVDKSDAKHFNGLQEILNKPLKQCLILSNDRVMQSFGENITAMHVAAFLCP